MLYKKLEEIYQKSECNLLFSRSLFESFLLYVKHVQKTSTLNFINPYDFAETSKVPLKDSLKFIIFFTDPDDGAIEIIPFFECFTSTCSERIFLPIDEVNDDEVLTCNNCGAEYEQSEIKPFVKVYFKIKENFTNDDFTDDLHYDPNSTSQIMTRLESNLKFDSPSSSTNIDGGDITVNLDEVIDNNSNSSGNPINKALPTPTQRLRDKLSRRRLS